MASASTIWARAEPLRRAMHDMAFNRELAAGTLSRGAFRHYMIQDALYLQGYARVLAIGAAKAPDADTILEFAKASETAIVVERALHQGYLDQFGVSASDLAAAAMAPSCAAYVNFILAEAATGSFATLVGAVLPCFWVYREIGLHIKASGAPENFYQPWIDTYADEAFGAATERMIAIYDRCARAAGAEERARMELGFLNCTRYEWMFWDGAYREEQWPIAIT
jgi:thiaminase/transcriptional activator TenA